MIRKITGLFAGLLICVAVYAASAPLRNDHPDAYTVRRGDTLWAISAQFLAKPWRWPEIWQVNPQLRNPHRIYPGDVLKLSPTDRNGGVPTLRLEPSIHQEEAPIPAISLAELRTFLRDTRVVDSNTLSEAPYVMGFEEGQLRGTVGQNIYVRKLDARPGRRWAIVRPSQLLREHRGEPGLEFKHAEWFAHRLDSNVAMVGTPWREDLRNDDRYGRGKDLGLEVNVIGSAEVLRSGDPSTLLLLNGTREIRQGDRLLPLEEAPCDPYFYPHPPKKLSANARVIGLADSLDSAGRHEVVMLSVGKQDGADNGQVYSVYQPGEVIHDDVAGNNNRRSLGHNIALPEELSGHVMIFRTFDRVSYGLVMDNLKPIHLGERLALPE